MNGAPDEAATLAHPLAGLGRESLIALASLVGVTALAWLYLWLDAATMGDMAMDGMVMGDRPMAMAAGGMMDAMSVWLPSTLALTFAMWAIMMVGMMLPSAAPAILLYGSLVRRNREQGRVLPAIWVFALGYLFVWTAFSALATMLQTGLENVGLLTPMMVSDSPWLTGGLLLAAGAYQWMPAKQACLRKCRAPLQFFLFHWRPGAAGAFRMGAEHGLFCLGCCWALMLLLFTAGVMNLLWVALIAGFVFVEKVLPAGPLTAKVAGLGLVAAGTGWVVSSLAT